MLEKNNMKYIGNILGCLIVLFLLKIPEIYAATINNIENILVSGIPKDNV